MSELTEPQIRIRDFQDRFINLGQGDRPFWLLCLSAFPIAVTPDLLYRLWQNFRRLFPDEAPIERVAVADVLLWSAWRETAPDVFELDESVRYELLLRLKRFNELAIAKQVQRNPDKPVADLMQALAQFLYQYTTQDMNEFGGTLLQAAQRLGVQAVLAPGKAVEEIVRELEKFKDNESEILRIRNLVGALASMHTDFEPLLSLTKSLKAFHQSIDKEFWQQPLGEVSKKSDGSIVGISTGLTKGDNYIEVMLPTGMTMDLPEREEAEKPNRLFLLTIAIDDYEGRPLKGCVNDAKLLSEVLPNYFRADNREVIKKSLINEEATKTAVLEAFKSHLDQAGPDDIVAFTFSGHGQNAREQSPQNTINTYGFLFQEKEDRIITPNDLKDNTITEKEFRELVQTAGKNDPHVLLITDTHNGSANWLNPTNPKHIILMAGSDWDLVYEDQYEGKTHGRFTATLVQALRSTRGRAPQTYHRLIRNIYGMLKQDNRDQTPQLFGMEQAILRPFLSTDDSRMLYLRECLLQKNPSTSADDEIAFHESFSLQSATDSILERYTGIHLVSSEYLSLEDVLRLKQAMLVNDTERGLSAIYLGSDSGLSKTKSLMTRIGDSLVSNKQINARTMFYQER